MSDYSANLNKTNQAIYTASNSDERRSKDEMNSNREYEVLSGGQDVCGSSPMSARQRKRVEFMKDPTYAVHALNSYKNFIDGTVPDAIRKIVRDQYGKQCGKVQKMQDRGIHIRSAADGDMVDRVTEFLILVIQCKESNNVWFNDLDQNLAFIKDNRQPSDIPAVVSYDKFVDEVMPAAICTLVSGLLEKQRQKISRQHEVGVYSCKEADADMVLLVVNCLIAVLQCRLVDDGVHPTSLYEAVNSNFSSLFRAAGCIPKTGDNILVRSYKWYQLAKSCRSFDYDMLQAEAIDWSIATAQLAINPSIANLFLSIVRQLNRIFKMDMLSDLLFRYISEAFEMFGVLVEPLKSAFGSGDVIATSLNETTYAQATKFISWITQAGESASVVASVLASLVVTIVVTVMGRDLLRPGDSKPLIKKLGDLGMSLSGCRRGFEALKCMIGEVEKWMLYAVNYVTGRENKNALMTVISEWDIQDDGEFEKAKVFEHVEYLLDPRNYDAVRANDSKRRLLLRVTGFSSISAAKTCHDATGYNTCSG